MGKIIVTSALPYANGPIHIGHLVEYIQTDIFVRYLKLLGEDAIYCCADDTHGTAIEINAQKAGVKPEEFIKKWFKEHQESFSKFHIHFDSYHSTNSDENKYFSELLFNRLQVAGKIYEKEVEQAYDQKEKRFLPDRYVKGKCPHCKAEDQYGDQCEACGTTYKPTDLINPLSTLSKTRPVMKKSVHYFFKLRETSDDLEKWIKNNPNLQPEVKKQILQWIEKGLEDWCISRDGPYFGFQIPGTNKYFYVWLDAPVGYISSFAHYLGGDVKKAEEGWNKSRIIHFIGKDINYFHLLFWPAVLMHSKMQLPEHVHVHGFLTVNKEKMSKSRGTFLTAEEWAELSNPEFLRYYYAANLTNKVEDIDLDVKHYVDSINNELVSNIANFIYRTLSFQSKSLGSELGKEVDLDFVKKIEEKQKKVLEHYKELNLRKAMNTILEISSEGNKYFQDKEPWVLVKEDKDECAKVLTTCTNLAKNIIILLKPVLPVFAKEIEKQLNLKDLSADDLGFDLKAHKIGKASIVYEKIEEFNLGGSAFDQLNLKVAEVLDVKQHPNADKLYVLKLGLGTEERQLVAGLKPYYEPSELKGKKLVMVTNLEPANLRGEKSQGMLLAAEGPTKENNATVGVLFVEKAKPGTQVFVQGAKAGENLISFDDFMKIKLEAKDSKAFFEGKELKAGDEIVKVDKVIKGKVR
ncbi:methionine--tRNA ligase [Nanoarchaeota archaeon]